MLGTSTWQQQQQQHQQQQQQQHQHGNLLCFQTGTPNVVSSVAAPPPPTCCGCTGVVRSRGSWASHKRNIAPTSIICSVPCSVTCSLVACSLLFHPLLLLPLLLLLTLLPFTCCLFPAHPASTRTPLLLEVCCDSMASVVAAVDGGTANRTSINSVYTVDSTHTSRLLSVPSTGCHHIELCSALASGGLTPSVGLLHTVVS